MVFSSITFLTLFLPITLCLYFVCRDLRWRNAVLLVVSLFFYSWGEPVWIICMLASTAVNYLCARLIDRSANKSAQKLWLAIGAVISIAFLVYFKYAAFFVNSFGDLFNINIQMPAVKLPIGISFYTFQVLTYTVDVYRKKAPVQKNLFLLLLYVSCFPQLIAGPIVQYNDVALQINNRESGAEGFANGMRRFVTGLAKKVLLANICAAILGETTLAGAGESLSVAGAWYAAFIYSMQIYFDFSAYSDMAIGLGEVFGFTYKENFDYPYISRSISEFWRRWHISLGSFFREYVYIPLGGNRVSRGRYAFNLMVVWSLTGLWHGASWNFILWGVFYGLLIMFERFIIKDHFEKIPGILRVISTFIITVFGWVIFYYTDFASLGQHVAAMVGIDTAEGFAFAKLIDPLTVAVIKKYTVFPAAAFICSMPILPFIKKKLGDKTAFQAVSYIIATVLLVLSVIFLIGQSYNPFIYFRF